MKVIDLHCDALLKLQMAKGALAFKDNDQMHITYEKLRTGNIKVQAFAIFIYPEIVSEEKYASALEQVKYFKEEVLAKNDNMVQIKKLADIATLAEDEIGAFLTLESVECIGNDITKLAHLIDEGVLSVGLTWNPANLACDGIEEKRGAGLSHFGEQIVDLLNERKVLVDMAHISEQGFWDCMQKAKYVINSHANARAICGHKRNMTKEQIEAIIEDNRMMHLVYCPPFVKDGGENVTIDDLMKHVDYVIELGGAKNLGLGSDFDGIMTTPSGLENASMVRNLLAKIEVKYGTNVAEDIAYNNFMSYIQRM